MSIYFTVKAKTCVGSLRNVLCSWLQYTSVKEQSEPVMEGFLIWSKKDQADVWAQESQDAYETVHFRNQVGRLSSSMRVYTDNPRFVPTARSPLFIQVHAGESSKGWSPDLLSKVVIVYLRGITRDE